MINAFYSLVTKYVLNFTSFLDTNSERILYLGYGLVILLGGQTYYSGKILNSTLNESVLRQQSLRDYLWINLFI